VTVDELFDAWERAWSGRDPEAFAPLCDADVHYEDPLTPEPLSGAEAIVERAQQLWTAFPDARLQPTGPRLTDGQHAAGLATHCCFQRRFEQPHGIALEAQERAGLRVTAAHQAIDLGRGLHQVDRRHGVIDQALVRGA
jgi:hypothetical protein